MPRIGLGRWILSWLTKPLVAMKQSFESILGIAQRTVPGISQSAVAGAYRAAEKALDIQPTIDTMNRAEKWEPSLMLETDLGAPRRYLVTFEVQVSYPAEKRVEIEQRHVYFMERMSASGYEQAYLSTYMGEGARDTGIIRGARAIDVQHNSGWSY